MKLVRQWDRATASRVTQFVANSQAVRSRIQRFYGREAQVIHPPVDTDFFTPEDGPRSGFLYVGRLVAYKRADLVVDAFRGLPYGLTVIGEGQLGPRLQAAAAPNTRFIPRVSANELRNFYRRAEALVFPAEEDFGIAMAEAQACGTPVIGLSAGGAVDIVEAGKTGWLLDLPEVHTVRDAVRQVVADPLDPQAVSASAQRFSIGRFHSEIQQALNAMLDSEGVHRTTNSRAGRA